MNAIKNAAAKKPKKKVKRPEVMMGFPSKILLNCILNIASWKMKFKNKFASTHLFDNLYLIQNRYQAQVFDMVENRKFEMFIILVITVNMIVMMVQHYDQPPQVTLVLDIL